LEMKIFIILVIISIYESSCAPPADKINSLPGLSTQINFDQYSGYLNIDTQYGKNLFYWFVESQNNPATDPLLIWLQGGPGCSSLFGFLTEHGPFRITANQTVELNPYSWNKLANVLYVEAPVGVGFSYSVNTVPNLGDNSTLEDNYQFLLKWFAAFPEYSQHDFYISGESYGGHYVPQLAWRVLKGNQPTPLINLRGILVGNPYTDDVIDDNSLAPFIFYHHLCSLATWRLVETSCNLSDISVRSLLTPAKEYHDYRRRVPESPHASCSQALAKMNSEMGDNTNQYDIYWPCLAESGLDCMDYSAETKYLNSPAVQSALHAKAPVYPWSVCASIQYRSRWPTVVNIYPALMNAIRVTVFAGDVTFNVPALGTQVWVENFGRKVIREYQPWLLGGQVAGYLKQYDGITYVTVKNSGHMVPTFTPQAGLELLRLYLQGKL